MSRHNTPGTIKIGNTVVQTGGGAYTPGGVTSITPQRRMLKTKEEIPDDRERFIANQAQKAANQQAQDLINLANRRSDVETALRFAPETVDRSDFTGFNFIDRSCTGVHNLSPGCKLRLLSPTGNTTLEMSLLSYVS